MAAHECSQPATIAYQVTNQSAPASDMPAQQCSHAATRATLIRDTHVPLLYVTCLSLVLYCETIPARMLVNEDGTLSSIPIVIDATLLTAHQTIIDYSSDRRYALDCTEARLLTASTRYPRVYSCITIISCINMTHACHDSPIPSTLHLGNCWRHMIGITYLCTTVSHTYTPPYHIPMHHATGMIAM